MGKFSGLRWQSTPVFVDGQAYEVVSTVPLQGRFDYVNVEVDNDSAGVNPEGVTTTVGAFKVQVQAHNGADWEDFLTGTQIGTAAGPSGTKTVQVPWALTGGVSSLATGATTSFTLAAFRLWGMRFLVSGGAAGGGTGPYITVRGTAS